MNLKLFGSFGQPPAEIVKVEIDKDKKTANVYVTEDQQSIAIGRGGQNVRLASRLTGYELNIETTAPKSAEKKPRKNVEEDRTCNSTYRLISRV